MTGVGTRATGPFLALAAALLFGLSAPAAKVLLTIADPWLLAGLLYLSSGVGLGLYRLARPLFGQPREAALARHDIPWLAVAILAGGIAGPVLMLFGLASGSATQSALLLNLEGVFTALVAWFVWHEAFDRRIAAGMVAIALGALVLAWHPAGALALDGASVLVMGACLAWAVDNNVTRRIATADAVQIAACKGLVAGTVNLAIALAGGAALPDAAVLSGSAVVGVLAYGSSLVLFVRALRELGAARTAAYFSTAPFIGALAGVLALNEPLSSRLLVGAALMTAGVWLHLSERHEHPHTHEAVTHDHRHRHDDGHHDHVHADGHAGREAHAHIHRHPPIEHRHPHYPDVHHRHRH
jgi:drug/metabolite transporter (DMT)-like permease